MPSVKRVVEVALSLLLAASVISCAGTSPSPAAPSQMSHLSQSVTIDARPADVGDMQSVTEERDDQIGLTQINIVGTWVGGFTSSAPTTARPCVYAGTLKSITLVVMRQAGNRATGYYDIKGLKKTGPAFCRNLTNYRLGFGNNGIITGNKVKITINTFEVWQLNFTGLTKVAGLATGTVTTGQGSLNGIVKLSRIKL
jgi:hypothetical protein